MREPNLLIPSSPSPLASADVQTNAQPAAPLTPPASALDARSLVSTLSTRSPNPLNATSSPTPLRAARGGASRADRVYESLREDIFELRLLPGVWLTEAAVAARFEVSRTPAREALQRLQGDGLMRGYVRGGWEVAPIDFSRFDDLYEMRELIETFAIRRLCERHARGDRAAVQALDALGAIWLVPEAARLTDARRVAALDEAFHLALVDAVGNAELSAALRRVTDRIHVVHRLGFVYGERVGETYAEHAELIGAIRAGGVGVAIELAERHVRRCRAEICRLGAQRLELARGEPAGV
ncbi:GntR family transcriptional regulator [Paraburkholderia tropica]|uniref:Transcriptional regulator, GntR family n=1 Tax=Paraburkholderia tropica TaxID=92647 RepID=A0AAQ1JSI0_9BURK|nr:MULTISPECIES: GntR family transcriptional regulator [Paraburkholderia]MBB2977400.1 DNA-binding GntR family transcriptional regulator [Paraburkholderia tropica]QNB10613.1 GntR family transcriptional regulator [Paraburkholderia tropica]RQM45550.1 GntR family transcriptional regulator [Paraburkholderia bannensis]RQN35364.1 GntR family transcriptional regulator [Paraburkholderia tropica]SEJ09658.1 transcriptional regulator, GntR family [Paraburkholderia tropica]